jgi:hypothetical protein
MQKGQTTLTPEQMATLAVNLLNQSLLEAGRTQAKQLFRRLETREPAPLTNLKTDDGGVIRVDCQLDSRAFVGGLNFSSFRDGVLALLSQLSDTLRAEQPLRTFSPLPEQDQPLDADTPARLFAVGGLTTHDGNTNMLMLGVRPEADQPVLKLQLMYVDPTQFQSESSTS